MYKKYQVIFTIFIILFFLAKCATKGRPGGGPIDKTPPEIIYTFPDVDSLNIRYLDEIHIYFSERMDENSVNKSLFISPALDYEVDWSGGDELTLEISPDSIKQDQTYVITIGSDAQDTRRNKMTTSFQFAFSTGNYLDQGKISGQVFGLNKSEVMYIYAYEITEKDTMDPRYQSARFLTQSGKNGKFFLSYLPLKKYRVFAIEDQNKNFLLDASYERVGIPTNDAYLDSSNMTISGLDFKLSQVDTTAPFITGARSLFNNSILLRASEKLKELSVNNIKIVDTLRNNQLNVLGVSGSSQSNSQYLLYTEIQDSNAYYKLSVSDIADTNENQQPEQSIVYFAGNSKKDTNALKIPTILPPDSAQNFPITNGITAEFSLAVDANSLNNGFIFLNDLEDTLSGKWDLKELKDGEFKPDIKLEPGKNYRYILNTKLISSVWGDTLPDTVYNHIFSTTSTDEFGSISGTVITDSTKFSQLQLEIQSIKRKSESYPVEKLNGNKFKIDWVPEGYYIFRGYFDIDNDKKWSPGKLEPFQYAEPTFIKEDTIRVRKRWETEDILIRFED